MWCYVIRWLGPNIVPLYSWVKGQVDEEVTLDDECTTFLCNFRTAALQRHIAEDCTAQLHLCINNHNY